PRRAAALDTAGAADEGVAVALLERRLRLRPDHHAETAPLPLGRLEVDDPRLRAIGPMTLIGGREEESLPVRRARRVPLLLVNRVDGAVLGVVAAEAGPAGRPCASAPAARRARHGSASTTTRPACLTRGNSRAAYQTSRLPPASTR